MILLICSEKRDRMVGTSRARAESLYAHSKLILEGSAIIFLAYQGDPSLHNFQLFERASRAAFSRTSALSLTDLSWKAGNHLSPSVYLKSLELKLLEACGMLYEHIFAAEYPAFSGIFIQLLYLYFLLF
jgi:hypothetical protein